MSCTELPLLRHGEYITPDFDGGAWGQGTAEDRPDGAANGIVKRFAKDRQADPIPLAMGWIKAIYADAIEYAGSKPSTKGYPFFAGIFFGSLLLAATVLFTYVMFWDDWVITLIAVTVAPVFLAISVWSFTTGIRTDLFRPLDEPVIFDRKHRKVYRIQRERPAGLLGLFKHWPLRVCEYDWDLVDAEHSAQLVATGGSVMRNHSLIFTVRKSVDDPTLIDGFQIASPLDLGETTVAPMYEHIRRFMESHGPHLPMHDEPLTHFERPASWTQSVGASGILGEGYSERWHTHPFLMAFFHVGFVVFFPMSLLVGTGHWLSFKTAFRVGWPEAVKQAVGAPTRMGKGW